MICLPAVAKHEGICLHCDPSSTSSSTSSSSSVLTPLFESLGGVVTLQSESELEACMMTTCMMGPLYGIIREGRDWLLKNTEYLSPTDASYLICKQYIGAILDMDRHQEEGSGSRADDDDENGNDDGHGTAKTSLLKTNPRLLDDLIEEQTPGGLNEQALVNLDTLGGLQAQRDVMDAILARIRGKSDGFV